MIALPPQIRVFLYRRPTDMRKSFHGLVALTDSKLKQDALSGSLFVFVNRRRDRFKIAQKARADCFAVHQETVIKAAKADWKSDGKTNKQLAKHIGISEAEASHLESRLQKKGSSDADEILRRLGVDPKDASPNHQQVITEVMKATLAAAIEVRRSAGEQVRDIDLSDELMSRIENAGGHLLLDLETLTEDQCEVGLSRILDLMERKDEAQLHIGVTVDVIQSISLRYFHRHFPRQLGVLGQIDLAKTSTAKNTEHFVAADAFEPEHFFYDAAESWKPLQVLASLCD